MYYIILLYPVIRLKRVPQFHTVFKTYGVQYSNIRCRLNSQLHTVFKVYWSQHRQQAHWSPESLLSHMWADTLQLFRVSITVLYMRTKTLAGSRTDGK